MTQKYTAIGLMSGTSLDGVDAVLLETDGEKHIINKKAIYRPYTSEFRGKMQHLAREDIPLVDMLRLEQTLTEEHAAVVQELLSEAFLTAKDIDVIGFHGQTIRHMPEEGLTLQIGNASLLAEKTGIPVVADFRRRDMAVKGEGAPLAPLFHQALFSGEELPTAVLNVGGVANLTWIHENGQLIAGDTGPGMGLIDALVKERSRGEKLFDEDGEHAESGIVDMQVVLRALELPYFKKHFPKSADRYDFDAIDVSSLMLENACATLVEITAESIIKSLKDLPKLPKRLWVTGGGARHPVLMKRLKEIAHKDDIEVFEVSELGLNGSFMEAECFAWLAVRRLQKKALSVPSTTGCQKAVCGGVLTA